MENKKAGTLRFVAGVLSLVALIVAFFFVPIVSFELPLTSEEKNYEYVWDGWEYNYVLDSVEVKKLDEIQQLLDYIDTAEEAHLERQPEKQKEIEKEFDAYREMFAKETITIRKTFFESLTSFYPALKVCHNTEIIRNIGKGNPFISSEGMQKLADEYYKEIGTTSLETATLLMLFVEFNDLSGEDYLNTSLFDYISITGWNIIVLFLVVLGVVLYDVIESTTLLLKAKEKGNDPIYQQTLIAKGRGNIYATIVFILLAYSGSLLQPVFDFPYQDTAVDFSFDQVTLSASCIVVLLLICISVVLFGLCQYLSTEKGTLDRKMVILCNVGSVIQCVCLFLVGISFKKFITAWQATTITGSINIVTYMIVTVIFVWCAYRLLYVFVNSTITDLDNKKSLPSAVAVCMIQLIIMLLITGLSVIANKEGNIEEMLNLAPIFWTFAITGSVGAIIDKIICKKMKKQFLLQRGNKNEKEKGEREYDILITCEGEKNIKIIRTGEKQRAVIRVAVAHMEVNLKEARKKLEILQQSERPVTIEAGKVDVSMETICELMEAAGATVQIVSKPLSDNTPAENLHVPVDSPSPITMETPSSSNVTIDTPDDQPVTSQETPSASLPDASLSDVSADEMKAQLREKMKEELKQQMMEELKEEIMAEMLDDMSKDKKE